MDPGILGHKSDAYGYDDQFGLELNMIEIHVDDDFFLPDPENLKVYWSQNESPTVVAKWQAGSISIEESFFCPDLEHPILVISISVSCNCAKQHHGSTIDSSRKRPLAEVGLDQMVF